MSLDYMKEKLETHLRLNLTDIAIKWEETNFYIKNNINLSESEIGNLNLFVEPKCIVIDDERELMSSGTPFKTSIFFQINIYNKRGIGTGLTTETIKTLNTMYREQYIDGMYCDRVRTENPFVDGENLITPHRLVFHLWN